MPQKHNGLLEKITNNNSDHHPTLDFEHWASIFPRESCGTLSGHNITNSPKHLCEVEFARNEVSIDKLYQGVPADLFLWKVGSPVHPFLTKIGGVPYRESNDEWPTLNEEPYTFLAQFCFLDSKDILPRKLPGDVLLVFRDPNHDLTMKNCGIHTEWVDISSFDLKTIDNSMLKWCQSPELAGIRHRTVDFPNAGQYFDKTDFGWPYLLPVCVGTKIGTEGFFWQGDPRPEKNSPILISTLGSLQPFHSWPFVNMESLAITGFSGRKGQPKNIPCYDQSYDLMFGDLGSFYFFLNESDEVLVEWSC